MINTELTRHAVCHRIGVGVGIQGDWPRYFDFHTVYQVSEDYLLAGLAESGQYFHLIWPALIVSGYKENHD